MPLGSSQNSRTHHWVAFSPSKAVVVLTNRDLADREIMNHLAAAMVAVPIESREEFSRFLRRLDPSVVAAVFAGQLPAGASQVFWDGTTPSGPAPAGAYEAAVLVRGPFGTTRHAAAFTIAR